jgi:hypothetical protein
VTSGEARWTENWRAIAPHDAVCVKLPRGQPKRSLGLGLATLFPGTPVVLYTSAPGAIRRCRSFVKRVEIEVEGEYLAFPSALAPAYLVEDAPDSARLFFRSLLPEPPRPGLSALSAAVLYVVRTLASRRAIRRIAPGRVVVGRLR